MLYVLTIINFHYRDLKIYWDLLGVLIIFNEGKETGYKGDRLNNASTITPLFSSIIIIYSKDIFTPNNFPTTFLLISNYRNRLATIRIITTRLVKTSRR